MIHCQEMREDTSWDELGLKNECTEFGFNASSFDIQKINSALTEIFGDPESDQDPLDGSEEYFEDELSDEEYSYSDIEDRNDLEEEPIIASTPFWFGNEEPKQIQMIFQSYSNHLKVTEQAKSCIREPIPFVGRIHRTKVRNDVFTTLDKVDIYRKTTIPPESVFPVNRTCWVLTTWSDQDGLPLQHTSLNAESKYEWKEQEIGDESFLVCAPFYSSVDYHYLVLQEEYELSYHTPHHPSFQLFLYDVFIPEDLRHPQLYRR